MIDSDLYTVKITGINEDDLSLQIRVENRSNEAILLFATSGSVNRLEARFTTEVEVNAGQIKNETFSLSKL